LYKAKNGVFFDFCTNIFPTRNFPTKKNPSKNFPARSARLSFLTVWLDVTLLLFLGGSSHATKRIADSCFLEGSTCFHQHAVSRCADFSQISCRYRVPGSPTLRFRKQRAENAHNNSPSTTLRKASLEEPFAPRKTPRKG
jgi:hypothetical protein